jgi:hypothetical protein
MLTAAAGAGPAGCAEPDADLWPPDGQWSFRVAGAHSGCPALELYEAGVLLDVVTATPVAPVLLRGGRALCTGDGPRAFAWGRMRPPGAVPAVEFSRGRLRREVRHATAINVTSWCWIAAADGHFDAVSAVAGDYRMRRPLRRSRPCR